MSNDYRMDFANLKGKFIDYTGKSRATANDLWAPIVITREEIDAEVQRLADLAAPANGRRESLIAHPSSKDYAPGMAPGIQVRLSVLKPGEKSAPFRHNATEVNFCIGGSGGTDVGGRSVTLHSRYQPIEEAKRLIEPVPVADRLAFYVFGTLWMFPGIADTRVDSLTPQELDRAGQEVVGQGALGRLVLDPPVDARGLEDAEPEDEQRHPGDRGDRAQRLHGRIEQLPRQPPIARDGAEDGSGDDAEAEAGANARHRRGDMA